MKKGLMMTLLLVVIIAVTAATIATILISLGFIFLTVPLFLLMAYLGGKVFLLFVKKRR
jgi:hypothetical protein